MPAPFRVKTSTEHMPNEIPFHRAAILGTGLIGGSFALALRSQFPQMKVTGFDRSEIAERAVARGAVQSAAADLASAVRDADLVYVALPIGAIIESLPAIAAAAPPKVLITDAGSTKRTILRAAQEAFRGEVRFLGGHPMAGKESPGIEHASADLFCDAPYALIGSEQTAGERERAFAELLRGIGARPIWCDADTHDWAVAIVSHLPQLASIALSGVVESETDETGLPISMAGPGLLDSLRLAGSPYEIWRDILLTNADNISRGLDRLAQAVEHLRTVLTSKELRAEFQTANHLYDLLRDSGRHSGEPQKRK